MTALRPTRQAVILSVMAQLAATVFRRPLTRACWQETWYLCTGLLTGTFGFTVIVSAFSTAAGLAILIVGLPLAALIARFDRWFCELERRRAGGILGRAVPAPYAPIVATTRLGRWLSPLRDPQTWYDAVWMLAALPVGVVGFSIAVTMWTAVLALLSAPIWFWSLPGWIGAHDVVLSITAPLLAVPAAVATAWCVRGLAWSKAALVARLLGPNRTEVLEQRVQTLSETRAGAIDASVTELQRVERDLHDGAQARLVALAMDLGLAEQRLANADPESAAEHVASARGQARAAMAELRDLVRGIGPSILTDRGLDAALTALVSGRTPPVDLQVELTSTEVTARETAAYFVVAEALTNARKHAQPSEISVHVRAEADDRLIVEIADDGVGGADPQAGSGLAGLQKRVAALDGTLSIVSPPGGPTTVRAELP
jgi:signal transduction histidine kinase